MPHLLPVCASPQFTGHFDVKNDWLYLEWEGNLTLPVVKQACLQLAHCVLAHPYARVLNCNTQVTGVDLEVGPWLACHFLPHLRLAGIEQVAWICASTLPGLNMVQTVLSWLPKLQVTIFTDLEDGVHWLQRYQPVGRAAPAGRAPATQAKLAQVVVEFERLATEREPALLPR